MKGVREGSCMWLPGRVITPLLSSGAGSGKALLAAFASRFVFEVEGFLAVCLTLRVLAGNFFP